MPGYKRKAELARGSVAATSQSEPFDASSFDGIFVWSDGAMSLEGSLDGGTKWNKVQNVLSAAYDTVANTVVVMPDVPALLRFNNGGAGAVAYRVEGYRQISGLG